LASRQRLPVRIGGWQTEKPGDHPLTDILNYGVSDFPEDITSAVRSLSKRADFESVEQWIAQLLWDHWPHWRNVTPDFGKVRAALDAIKQSLPQ
jgi:hypothetical protein